MSDTDLLKTEEILKEFLESAQALAQNNASIEEKYVLDNIKTVLESCIKRGSISSNAKSDLSIKILEILVKSYSNIDYAIKMSEFIAALLDKVRIF